ncbi:MAG: phospholipase D family protein [Sphingomonadaceae bacterium]
MLFLQIAGAALLAILLTGLILRLLFPLPPLEPRAHSVSFTGTEKTSLGRSIARLAAAHPGKSGVYPLGDAHEAFAARILLANAAERSLDLQYYIFRADVSGRLLIAALREAADRGVRVRILLDDNGTAGIDRLLAALDAHPNMEVRLFNPFVIRWPKPLGYLMDFFRLNRRMHNKSFTADGQATIIGGRNIGDEYFGAQDSNLFADLDVLGAGPVAAEVSADFDLYWNCASSWPAARILKRVHPEEDASFARALTGIENDPKCRAYRHTIGGLSHIRRLLAGDLPLEWTKVRMVSDNPAKALGKLPAGESMVDRFVSVLEHPKAEAGLVSPYFVPTKAGVEAFAMLGEQGVAVSALTNSFRASDVILVHAGYSRYRKPLLRAGVRLFELCGEERRHASQHRRLLGSGSGRGGSRPTLRSVGTVLHAKTFTGDRRHIFIGSFNFDPRSMHLNTELGFTIESPGMAGELQDRFDAAMAPHAYELVLTDRGRLNWIERDGHGGEVCHNIEPGTRFAGRMAMHVVSRLPIEWML